MSRDARVVIGYICRGFAWLVGGVSVVGSFLELGYGQAHGPSMVVMSLLAAPFVITAAVISRRLLR